MDRPEDRLALIEWSEADGRSGRALDVLRWPVTLGRALDNTVVLSDAHVAPHHASIDAQADGAIQLRALASRNGALVNGQPLAAGDTRLLTGSEVLIQLGQTRLRLRLRDAVLAPEKPLAARRAIGPWALAACGLLLVALMAAQHWIGLDPGAEFSTWLPLSLGLPAVLAAWCSGWGLASKLFQHRFEFWRHLAIALPGWLAIECVDVLLPQVAAALDLPLLWQLKGPVIALAMAWVVREHLCAVLPNLGRGITVLAGVLLALGAAVGWTQNLRQHDRFHAAPFMATLPPPALRWGTPQKIDELVQAMTPLRDALKARVDEAAKDEPEDRDGSD
jgi:hypothetical protein